MLSKKITRRPVFGQPRLLERQVELQAKRMADRQARKVPWSLLLESTKKYIEWEAFTLWVRAIEEAEHQAPGWLCRAVEVRCPGIIIQKDERLWKRLDKWKQETIFAKPIREGWMRAISFYAVRNLVYARNWAYWEYCEKLWSARCPLSYPSLEEWKSAAHDCPDEVVDVSGIQPERKELVKAARRAGHERFERAVETYVEFEAFVCWLRPILDAQLPLPSHVVREFKNRYPSVEMDDRWNGDQVWGSLLRSHFREAQAQGWFEPVVYAAELDPRRMKVIDYGPLYWDDHWPRKRLAHYPSFEQWRREAESYTPDELDSEDRSSASSPG